MDENTQAPAEAAQNAAPEVVAPQAPAAQAPAAQVDASEPAQPKKVRRQRAQVSTNPVTAEQTTETVVDEVDAAALPSSVTLAAPYAFYDDAGELRSWAQGRVVDDPAEIALLVDRGAIFEG